MKPFLVAIMLLFVLQATLINAQCVIPPAPTGSATQTFCSGATVADLLASGTGIKWYPSATSGTAYAPTDLLRGTMSWGYHYYASQTVNGCESTDRLYVTVDVKINETRAPSFPFTTTWEMVSSNGKNNIALKTDGTLWTWGWNNVGQLGDGSTTDSFDPIQIGISNDWKFVQAGYQSHFAIKADGTLWAWGNNEFGQLGDGTTTNKSIPTKVGNASNWKSISTMYSHVTALRTDGTLWTWGRNQKGQLGIGTNNSQLLPVQIGTDTDWITISCGLQHTLALKANGTLWAWGGNYYQQLGNGDGTLADKNIPIQIGVDKNWKSIHASSLNSFAIKTDGTLWGWGTNTWGQLAIENAAYKDIPTKIGSDSNWLTLAPIGADRFHNIGIKTDGTVWAWGYNKEGQLGNGVNAETYTIIPFKIGTGTTWASVSVGEGRVAAIKKDGSLWEWGNVDYEYAAIHTGTYYLTPTFINPPNGLALQTFCESATVSDLFAIGTDMKWYTSATGGTPLEFSTVLQNETHYYATQKINYCESEPRLHAVVLMKANATAAPTGLASQTFCPGATIADVSVQGVEIQWYNTPTGGPPLVSSTLLSSGTHYYASQIIYGCESSSRLDVLITLTTPAPPTGSTSQTFCHGAAISDLSVQGAGVAWYSSATGGSPLLSSTLLSSGSHYYASQTINGCKSSTRLDVLITLTSTPPPTGPSSQSFCEGTTIGDLSAQGVGVEWYDTPTSGSSVAISKYLSSGSHYYASQTISGCKSSTRLDVLVTLRLGPTPPEGDYIQTLENGQTISDLVVIGSQIKWYENDLDASSRNNPLDFNTIVTPDSTYYSTQTVSGCESVSSLAVKVIVVTGLEWSIGVLEYYPNPVTDILNISSDHPIDRIFIFNSLGQPVGPHEINDQKSQLDLSSFGSGVYFIQIGSGNITKQLKIVKH